MTIPFFTHPALGGTRHGFFTREGGVSSGLYASLNCGLGSNDDVHLVLENQRRLCSALDARQENLVFLRQVHSATVISVKAPWPVDERPSADALVTAEKNIAIAVMAADCAPVLFHDEVAGVIGAAHAGWKGALAGVLEATITAMQQHGATPGNIRAVIGPCIQKESYEVGPEFPVPFLQQDESNRRFFRTSARSGHFMFDLPGYALHRMERCGIDAQQMEMDTLGNERQFFSYRRRTLRNEAANGIHMHAIMRA